MYDKEIFTGSVSVLETFDIKDRLFVVGTGSPEGVVSAPIGSRFFNSEADQGQSWEKITGTGNIGWRRLALLRSGKLVSSANYTFVLADAAEYVRFTGIAGTATVVPDRFETDREIHGEIEGGAKTFVAGAGVTLRYPAGGTNVAPTNSRFFIKFKSPNDAQLTIVPGTILPDTTGNSLKDLRVGLGGALEWYNKHYAEYRDSISFDENNSGASFSSSDLGGYGEVTGSTTGNYINGKVAIPDFRFCIVNKMTNPLEIRHNSTETQATSRFSFDDEQSVILPPGGWIEVMHISGRWRKKA